MANPPHHLEIGFFMPAIPSPDSHRISFHLVKLGYRNTGVKNDRRRPLQLCILVTFRPKKGSKIKQGTHYFNYIWIGAANDETTIRWRNA
jgi:hypothetical protein